MFLLRQLPRQERHPHPAVLLLLLAQRHMGVLELLLAGVVGALPDVPQPASLGFGICFSAKRSLFEGHLHPSWKMDLRGFHKVRVWWSVGAQGGQLNVRCYHVISEQHVSTLHSRCTWLQAAHRRLFTWTLSSRASALKPPRLSRRVVWETRDGRLLLGMGWPGSQSPGAWTWWLAVSV